MFNVYITLYNTLRITHVLYFYGGIQCFGNAFIIIIFQTRNRICEIVQLLFLLKMSSLGVFITVLQPLM